MAIKELENIYNAEDIRNSLITIKKNISDIPGYTELITKDRYYDRDILANLLMNEDPKIRKNAVLVMGMLNDNTYREIIYQGYMREETLFVKSAYLKALSEYDYSEYEDSLRNRKCILEKGGFDEKDLKHISEELYRLRIMLPDRGAHSVHRFSNPQKDVTVFLTCRKEFAGILGDEIKDKFPSAECKTVFCGISVRTGRITELADIRLYREMLFPVNSMRPSSREALVKDIISGDLFKLLDSLHEAELSAYKFRLSGVNINTARIARELEAASGGRLVNSVSDYEIELRLVENKEGRLGCLVKLCTYKDSRFSYRKNTLSTSLHPVNAACAIKLCEPYLKKNAQIIDLCCGVGTLLIERNRLVKAKYIYGVDTYGEAIAGARENTRKANTDINYIQRNFQDFRHEYQFDEIISQPPDALKDNADDFYKKFFDKAQEILRPDGIMILISREMGRIKKYTRLHREFDLIREIPFNSKEGIFIYIIGKRNNN